MVISRLMSSNPCVYRCGLQNCTRDYPYIWSVPTSVLHRLMERILLVSCFIGGSQLYAERFVPDSQLTGTCDLNFSSCMRVNTLVP